MKNPSVESACCTYLVDILHPISIKQETSERSTPRAME